MAERYDAITPHDLDEHPLNAAARAWIMSALDPMARPAEAAPPPPRQHRTVRRAPGHHTAVAAYDTLLGGTAWLLDDPLERCWRRLTRAPGPHAAQWSQASSPPSQSWRWARCSSTWNETTTPTGRGDCWWTWGEAHGLLYYRAVGRELRARIAAVRGDAA